MLQRKIDIMPIIELKDVSKLYGFGDATTVALEEVSLTVEPGEFVAIMGPSGSGKSTLMNIIGLLDRPTHGGFRLDGRAVEKLKTNARAKARRDKIGFVFQSSSLISSMTALENVALPLAYKGKRAGRRSKLAFDMLERVGLKDRAYFLPHQLSGGQVQRVTIARALINEPKILIADEPTGNLDSASSRLVMELLNEVHKMGNTILMVTHNPELTRYATRVLYMHDGEIVKDEKTRIGEVAKSATQTILSEKKDMDEEELASVSAVISEIPKHGDDTPRVRKPAKKQTRKRTAKKAPRRAKK
jgi:putative ABC transport system ATP-binding protein